MGFFNRKKKAEKDKHIKQEVSEVTSQKQSEADIDTTQEELEKPEIRLDTPERRKKYIENYCEQMV